ncbi:ABC transporter permease subunit [Haliangium ochraceum]|uniref:ABC-type Na+ efflux pump, permease component n=1 Tax=Haliangium ochraceum (strain DSM 14365 / JCM 11303 / SMP-2) TaxID=502025 RepID=D0LSJ9_HALO1|nr:ABC transporter permease subunit [Haliangium ochraceum]ACY15698.1 ABC-type Na+ efflux pump, permease component [Haliangium ochraceum DSM 14365]
MRDIWVIFRKELREVLRDRRTLMFMLALPLLVMPLLLEIGVRFAVDAQRTAMSETLRYSLWQGEALPALGQALGESPAFERVDDIARAEVAEAVAAGRIDFGLVVEGPAPAVADADGADGGAGPQHQVLLFYDNASQNSKVAERVGAVVSALSEAERTRRLTALGIERTAQSHLLTPVLLVERGTADMRAILGELLGSMLPYLLIIFCYYGALYPAADLAAGEKERGTLETLLLAPVSRLHIVLGKYLVVFVAAVAAAALTMLSLGVWGAYKASSLEGALGAVVASLGALDLVLIALMFVPAAALFAALLLSVSVYARNFKEAQSYAVPLNFLVILPAALPLLPGVEMSWGWAMVPITNIALAVKELVKGTMDYAMLSAILGSSVVLAGVCLGFCTWWFRRETVLFRV